MQYMSDDGPSNGILPSLLLSESTPTIEFTTLFNRLAAAYREQGLVTQASQMEKMADWAVSANTSAEEDTIDMP
jgi:hypothetical protein